MKSGKRIAASLLLGWGLCQPAWADIYAYTSADGSVSFSKVPTDGRYAILLGTPQPEAAAVSGAGEAPAGSGLTGKARYEQVVAAVSRAYGVDSALLHAVISVESGYNAKAISRKGAAGLMQLMPKTAKRYGVTDAMDP